MAIRHGWLPFWGGKANEDRALVQEECRPAWGADTNKGRVGAHLGHWELARSGPGGTAVGCGGVEGREAGSALGQHSQASL